MIWFSPISNRAAVVNIVNTEFRIYLYNSSSFDPCVSVTLDEIKQQLTDEEYIDLQRRIFEELV